MAARPKRVWWSPWARGGRGNRRARCPLTVEDPVPAGSTRKKKQNFENRLTADPEIKCYLPGVPRATYMPYPFQIFQSSQAIAIAYEYDGASATSS